MSWRLYEYRKYNLVGLESKESCKRFASQEDVKVLVSGGGLNLKDAVCKARICARIPRNSISKSSSTYEVSSSNNSHQTLIPPLFRVLVYVAAYTTTKSAVTIPLKSEKVPIHCILSSRAFELLLHIVLKATESKME